MPCLRKGSNTDHWEQLTLVSVYYKLVKGGVPIPRGGGSLIFPISLNMRWNCASETLWELTSLRVPQLIFQKHRIAEKNLGDAVCWLKIISTQSSAIWTSPWNSPHPNRSKESWWWNFSPNNHWTFAKVWGPSLLNSKTAFHLTPKKEQSQANKSWNPILYAFWSIGFSHDFLHVPYHPYLFFHTSKHQVEQLNIKLNSWLIPPKSTTLTPQTAVKITTTFGETPGNPIGVQQRQQWINRSTQYCRPC